MCGSQLGIAGFFRGSRLHTDLGTPVAGEHKVTLRDTTLIEQFRRAPAAIRAVVMNEYGPRWKFCKAFLQRNLSSPRVVTAKRDGYFAGDKPNDHHAN